MNDKDNKQDKNIIHFPELEKRQNIAKDKKKQEKQAKAEKKERDKQEEKYRSQYRSETNARKRAQNAMHMGTSARRTASGEKQKFINWEKITPFTRIMVGILLGLHVFTFFALDISAKINMIYHFGFTPAIYTGATPWVWSALFSPLTSLFLHSGWMHLIFNCIMMTVMGIFSERQFGTRKTVIFFTICGLCGNLFYILINPFSSIPVIGASGAISGLFALSFLNMLEYGSIMQNQPKRSPTPFILLWSAIIAGFGMLGQDISWQSHLGGFWSGTAIFLLWKKGLIRF